MLTRRNVSRALQQQQPSCTFALPHKYQFLKIPLLSVASIAMPRSWSSEGTHGGGAWDCPCLKCYTCSCRCTGDHWSQDPSSNAPSLLRGDIRLPPERVASVVGGLAMQIDGAHRLLATLHKDEHHILRMLCARLIELRFENCPDWFPLTNLRREPMPYLVGVLPFPRRRGGDRGRGTYLWPCAVVGGRIMR